MSEDETTEAENIKRDSFVAICGRVFHSDPDYFPQAEYHGRAIYFCTEVCLGAYLSDPERFVAAHKKSYKKTTEVVTT
jgi:YHS domain-containing protein